MMRYRASKVDCDALCAEAPVLSERAGAQGGQRKKFAHLKCIPKLDRLRLRGRRSHLSPSVSIFLPPLSTPPRTSRIIPSPPSREPRS